MQSKGNGHGIGFAKAFGTYNRYRRTLRHVYKATIRLLQANCNEIYFSSAPQNQDLNENQHALLSQTASNALAFIVIGQSYECKCRMVNSIFGQDVIPLDTDWIKYGRTVVFKYGPKPQLTVSLPDSFLLIESDVNTERNKDSLSWKEEFKLLENDISKITNGLVEITIHNPILKGSKLVLCGDTLESTYENLRSNIVSSVNGTMPVFLYALNQLPLTEAENTCLRILKAEFCDSAIFFSLFSKKSSSVLKSTECKFGNTRCTAMEHEDGQLKSDEKENIKGNDTISRRHTISSLEPDSVVKDFCNNPLLCKNFNFSFDVNQPVINNSNSIKQKPALSMCNATFTSDCLIHNLSLCSCYREFVEQMHIPFDCSCRKHPFKSSLKTSQSKFLVTETKEEKIKPKENPICTRKNPAYVACDKSVLSDERLKIVPLNSFFVEASHPKFHIRLLTFTRNMAKYYLVRSAQILHNFHLVTLNDTINFVFDLIRDLSITPRRVDYVREKEFQLYNQLNEVISHNQTKIQTIIENAIVELHENLLNLAQDFQVSEQLTNTQLKTAKLEIQEMVLSHIKEYTADQLNKSIQVMQDSFVGTLMRCLQCLESSSNGMVSPNDECASKHFALILNTAYNVQITVQSSSSVVNVVIDKLRQVMSDLSHHQTPVINDTWKRNAAEEILKKLSPNRLAKNICSQFQARLNHSHAAFLNALRHLELAHKCRLDNMAGSRHRIARVLTPAIAKLALESTSLIDGVLFGMPRMEREIGRGMYGVVYSCVSWGPHTGCAVKSVAPPDEKHFNDLSLEFYYTRKLPRHPRVVQICGSVIDDSYNSGIGPPAVLLIMERLHRDLYTSIKIGMSLCERFQVAVDVVEGIRYLHSQGLVHRDVKLKNVLLDHKGRAKITDLGFCKPGAMISGSIVGTPIHMPPELFSGNYSFSVDVYAFGILMWYLMAGTTRLPQNLELYTTKDHLWTAVRKGIRPERLQIFSDDVWELMQSCWASNPDDRPMLGVIEPKLKEMHTKSLHFSP